MKNNSNTGITLWSQLVFVMHATGIRQGELLSLKWHDNDSDRKNN
jgi:integrase